VPTALEAATQEDIAAAVRAARAALAAGGRRVSIVGMSYGGSLALLESAAEPPDALVLVNPLLGTLATPSFVPVSSDSLLDAASKLFRLSFRPVGFTRCNDPEGRKRQVAYATFPLAPCVAARDTSRRAAAVASVAAPALLMLSDLDRTTPAEASEAWFRGIAAPSKEVRRHPQSDHLLLLDHDAPAASDAIVRFLTTKR
jgi:esterase/lipase